jgi:hypothetical protein
MNTNNEHFLSNDLSEVRQQISIHHSLHFNLIKRVNDFCHDNLSKLKIYNRDPQQVIAACIAIKTLEDVQSSILLIESGFISQARSLLRVATEALIILAKIVKSEEFFRAYVLAGERDRLKFLNAIKANSLYENEDITRDITPELVEQLQESVEGTAHKNVEQWAKDVELDVMYDVVYRLFSQDVHTHPRVIEKHMTLSTEGEVAGFRCGPSARNDVSVELIEAVKILLLEMDAVGHLFEANLQQQIKLFWEEIKQILGDEANKGEGA